MDLDCLHEKSKLLSLGLCKYHGLSPISNLLPRGIGEYFLKEIQESIGDWREFISDRNPAAATFLDVEVLMQQHFALTEQVKGHKVRLICAVPSVITAVKRLIRIPINKLIRHRGRRKFKRTILLNPSSILLHRAAVLCSSEAALGFIYQMYFRPQKKKDRSFLFQCLVSSGLDKELAFVASELMPTSYVEQFKEIRSFVDGLSCVAIVSSIYGIMLDPVMAMIAVNSSAKVIYVQHGGGYCFVDDWKHEIEAESCDLMLYWGLGEINVRQTRFAETPSSFQDRQACKAWDVLFILSWNLGDDALEAIENAVVSLKNMLVASNNGIHLSIHPRCETSAKMLLVSLADRMQISYSYGVDSDAHLGSKIVVYDSIKHTLIYQRMVAQSPFVVLDIERDVRPRFRNAKIFLDLVKNSEIMSPSIESSFLRHLDLPLKWSDLYCYHRNLFSEARHLIVRSPNIQDFISRLGVDYGWQARSVINEA